MYSPNLNNLIYKCNKNTESLHTVPDFPFSYHSSNDLKINVWKIKDSLSIQNAMPCLFKILILFSLYCKFLLVILYILVYICISQSPSSSHHHHPCLPPLVSMHLFSTSVSLFLPCKLVQLYHFSRFHIYVLIYDICFSLSALLHSVWQSLGPSISLQMTQFHSSLWLSNIPLYICTTSLSIRLLKDIYIASFMGIYGQHLCCPGYCK